MNETNPSPVQTTIGVVRRLLRTREAAIYLGSSAWTVRRLVRDGLLPYVAEGDGGRWLFDLKDLDAYIEAHKRVAR